MQLRGTLAGIFSPIRRSRRAGKGLVARSVNARATLLAVAIPFAAGASDMVVLLALRRWRAIDHLLRVLAHALTPTIGRRRAGEVVTPIHAGAARLAGAPDAAAGALHRVARRAMPTRRAVVQLGWVLALVLAPAKACRRAREVVPIVDTWTTRVAAAPSVVGPRAQDGLIDQAVAVQYDRILRGRWRWRLRGRRWCRCWRRLLRRCGRGSACRVCGCGREVLKQGALARAVARLNQEGLTRVTCARSAASVRRRCQSDSKKRCMARGRHWDFAQLTQMGKLS